MATKKGSVQRSSAMDTKARSFTTSDTSVMPNIVMMPMTEDGILRRFVLNVLNLYGNSMFSGRPIYAYI